MHIDRHPTFKKHFKKRIAHDHKLMARTKNRIQLFMDNPHHPLLRDHALKGLDEDLRAFSITGDIRIVYRVLDDNTIQFIDIGTHNQVYK